MKEFFWGIDCVGTKTYFVLEVNKKFMKKEK